MTHQNQATIKLGKSFARLKKDLISSRKLLAEYVLPTGALKLSTSEKNCCYRTCSNSQLPSNTLKTNKETGNVTAKPYKHVFGRIVDFAKSMVNSKTLFTVKHQQVRSLISYINEAQMETTTVYPKTNRTNLIHNNLFNHSIKNVHLSAKPYSTKSKSSLPDGRHKYHKDVEKAMNQQILAELNACYAYLSMACYFGRTDVALPGCHGFFMQMHTEEHEHALTFINYQNLRGGHVKLCPIQAPKCQIWSNIQSAFCIAVELEKSVKEKLVELNDIAEKHHDLGVAELVTSHFIPEQDRSICELSRLLVRANKMVECGTSEYLFDKELHRAFVKNSTIYRSTTLKEDDKDNKSKYA